MQGEGSDIITHGEMPSPSCQMLSIHGAPVEQQPRMPSLIFSFAKIPENSDEAFANPLRAQLTPLASHNATSLRFMYPGEFGCDTRTADATT